MTTNLLSIGLYHTADVARYLRASPGDLRVKPDDVRRWAFGYERQGRWFGPAIKTALSKFGRSYVLTFLEFVELMYIKAMLETPVSWPKVREASQVIKRLRGVEHPFAMEDIFVDPAGIYMKLGREHGEPLLIELAGDAQVAMEEALRPYLHQLTFVQGRARQWFPLGTDELVVLDPARSFGAPIVREGGVRTELIANMHDAGDSVEAIARWFGITEDEVKSALIFENKLAA